MIYELVKPECSKPRRPALYRKRRNAVGVPGAPVLNLHSASHGMKSDIIARVQMNALPIQWAQAGKQGAELGRALEEMCEEVHGAPVTRSQALAINTAKKWEIIGGLAARWLRENPAMELGERLNFALAMGKASERRDAAIARLALERPADDDLPWLPTLPAPAPQTPPDDPAAVPCAPDAPQSIVALSSTEGGNA